MRTARRHERIKGSHGVEDGWKDMQFRQRDQWMRMLSA